jgi:hypothetical protein
MEEQTLTYQGYQAGHPWYYLLGGPVPRLKQIKACAAASGYKGFDADVIEAANRLPEPKRSRKLQKLQDSFRNDLRFDIKRYRQLVAKLRKDRQHNGIHQNKPVCCDVHTALSLTFSHLYNDFAHLHTLDQMMYVQQELFGIFDN